MRVITAIDQVPPSPARVEEPKRLPFRVAAVQQDAVAELQVVALADFHQVVARAVWTVDRVAGAKRHQHRQFRLRRPFRRHEQTIRNRLARAGKVVDAVLLAGSLIQRRVWIWLRCGRRGAACLCESRLRTEQNSQEKRKGSHGRILRLESEGP